MLCCTSPAHRLKQMHGAMPQNVKQPRPAACSKSSSHRSCVATPSSCSGTMAAVLLACSPSIMGDSDNADELYSKDPLSEADLQPCRPAACRDTAKPSTMRTHSQHKCKPPLQHYSIAVQQMLPAQSHTRLPTTHPLHNAGLQSRGCHTAASALAVCSHICSCVLQSACRRIAGSSCRRS